MNELPSDLFFVLDPSALPVPDPSEFWEGRTRALAPLLEEALDSVEEGRRPQGSREDALRYVLSRGLRHLPPGRWALSSGDLSSLDSFLQPGADVHLTAPHRLAALWSALEEEPFGPLPAGWSAGALGRSFRLELLPEAQSSLQSSLQSSASVYSSPSAGAFLGALKLILERSDSPEPERWQKLPPLSWVEASGTRFVAQLELRLHDPARFPAPLSQLAGGELGRLASEAGSGLELRGTLSLPGLSELAARYGVLHQVQVRVVEDLAAVRALASQLDWSLQCGTSQGLPEEALRDLFTWPHAHPKLTPREHMAFDDPEPMSLLSAGALAALREFGRLKQGAGPS